METGLTPEGGREESGRDQESFQMQSQRGRELGWWVVWVGRHALKPGDLLSCIAVSTYTTSNSLHTRKQHSHLCALHTLTNSSQPHIQPRQMQTVHIQSMYPIQSAHVPASIVPTHPVHIPASSIHICILHSVTHLGERT